MKSRSDSQLNLPPAELCKSEDASTVFRNSEGAAATFRNREDADCYDLSAVIFDEACADAKLSNKEIAYLVSPKGSAPVSESLVQKWRSPGARASPSLVQQLRLPPSYWIGLHRALDRRYGFGRAALQRLLEAAGSLALVVNE